MRCLWRVLARNRRARIDLGESGTMAAFGRANRVKGVVAIDGKAVRGAFARGTLTAP